jgi:hypothetical protein
MNKVFIYMIIHDLKHPTECILSSLRHMEGELISLLSEHEYSKGQHA